MSRSVYRYNVSLCYLYVSLTVSVVSVKRQEVTETAKSVTETSRTYRNFTMAVLYSLSPPLPTIFLDLDSLWFSVPPPQKKKKKFILNLDP